MVATVGSFDAVGRTRIAQLINKSNQFNLTTQRYTEADVATLEADAGAFTLQVRLRDRFADNGMICCVVCREMDVGGRRAWEIDTWLMSCRVLGRGVEALVLNCIVDAARQAGASTLVGVYRPTAKNEMVREHYARLGFRQTGEDAGITTWELALDDHVARPVQIRTETIAALDRVA